MTVIVLATKPVSGRIDRICKLCGNSYNGYNFVVCHSCENNRQYEVEFKW